MKGIKLVTLFLLALTSLSVMGCRRSSGDFWDDTRTAGRHMGRGLRSLGGKHGDSRQVNCREDFLCEEDRYSMEDFQSMQFDPIPDYDYGDQIEIAQVERRSQQAQVPQAKMQYIPGIEAFKDPKQSAQLAQIFRTIHFPYNSSLVKGVENQEAVRAIATYLKNHRNTYIFIEGHCDERGAEAYNLALGARRSNTVRNLLIKEGVQAQNIFTVSYGKERPIAFGHGEEIWVKNRRAEFKVFEQ